MRSWRGGVGMVDSGLGLLLGGAKKAKGSGLADGMASLYCDRRRRSGRVFRGSMQLAGAFRHTDSIVAVLGADDGSFVDVNPTFERVLGWHRDEVLGRRSLDLGLWAEFEQRVEIWTRLRSRRSIRALEVRFLTRDRRLHSGWLDCELIEADTGPVVLCLVRDYREDASAPGAEERPESYRALFQAAASTLWWNRIRRSIPFSATVSRR